MTAETHPVEREQLMAYLDGELAANEAARVAAHLTDCADCRQLEADLRSVSAQILSWNVEPAPQQLDDGVLAALHADVPQRTRKANRGLFRFALRHRIRIARWTLAAACVGVAAMILVKVFAPPSTDEFQRLEVAAKIFTAPPESLTRHTALSGGGGGGDHAKSRKSNGCVRRRILHRLQRRLSQIAPMESRAAVGSMSQMAKQRAADYARMNDNLAQPNAPMIARTASLKISAKDFQSARAGVDRIIATFHGFAASMTINNAVGEPQSLNAELHFPVGTMRRRAGGTKRLLAALSRNNRAGKKSLRKSWILMRD